MKPLYYLCLILLFCGCSPERAKQRASSTEERAEKTQNTLQEKYPELIAEKSAEGFPAKETEAVIRDTVSESVFLKEDPEPYPVSRKQTDRPAPARANRRPVVACPDCSYYINTIASLRQKAHRNAAALEVANEKYRTVQHALYREQATHRITKAELEKARKLRTAWIWFSVFLGLVVVCIIIGKIFRFI